MKVSDMTAHEELLASELEDPEFRAEWTRTALARAVALEIVRHRGARGLSQRALGELLGMKQPQVARLERGDHTPTIDTLIRLSAVLGIEFNLDIRPRGRRSVLATRRAQTDASVAAFEQDEASVSLAAA